VSGVAAPFVNWRKIMGERVKVKFLENYIAPTGAGIAGQKDKYKVFPLTDHGVVEVVGETPAATRETATVEAPEATGEAKAKPASKKKSKSSE
jgi:hypothetical protein